MYAFSRRAGHHVDFRTGDIQGLPAETDDGINDERAVLPDISNTEPQRLSFLVAAAMEIDAEVKQELLELRSTSERLERLRGMLNIAVKGYEERARIHELAKSNGHSGRRIELE